MISEYFIFDNIESTDMGLYNIRIESGMPSVPLWGDRQIVEEKTTWRENPYFYKVDKSPIEFQLTFSLLDEIYTPEKKYELIKWLIHDDYREFRSADNLDVVYYAIITNTSELFLNPEKKGYFTVTVRTNSWHPWTPTYLNTYDLSTSTPSTITLINESNIYQYYYPELEITLTGTDTEFSIVNNSDDGRAMTFSGLNTGETIYINNDKKQIISDTGLYRYSNLSPKQWFRLVYGNNNIVVNSKVILKTRMQFPIIT